MTAVLPNPFPYPQIKEEEDLDEPLYLPGFEYDWQLKAPVHDRLYYHHTLASIRQDRRLRHPHAPRDSLDYHLASIYNHTICPGDKKLIVLQAETIGLGGHRLLKNKRIVQLKRPARGFTQDEDSYNLQEDSMRKPGTMYLGTRSGGLTDKISPFSVKLGITSNHLPQSNAGFSRKVDGSYFSS